MKKLHNGGFIRPHYTKVIALVRIMDSAIVVSSLWVAIWILNSVFKTDYAISDVHIYYALGGALLFQLFADIYEVYYSWRVAARNSETLHLASSWLCAATVILAVIFFLDTSNQMSRLLTAVWFAVALVTLVLTHQYGRMFLGYLRRRGLNSRRVVIVGANQLGLRLAEAFRSMPWLGYRFAGYYDDRAYEKGRRIDCPDHLIAGNLNDLVEQARSGKIDEIFVSMPMRSEQRVSQLFSDLADTTASVYYVPDMFVFNLVQSRLDMVQGIPCVTVHGSPFKHQPINSLIKRLEDIILALAALTVLAVPMLLIALAVKLDSPGPAIFRQKRYGVRGEPIDVWKFRSMTVQENGDAVRQATRNDPRITRLGAFLRKSSLDELPQFINVLQGSMSIVGPRPHAIAHNEHYRKQINGYMLRHVIKPGITGLAQVNGCRGETDTLDKMERRVSYDLEYINHWKIWLDIKIIFMSAIKFYHDPQAY